MVASHDQLMHDNSEWFPTATNTSSRLRAAAPTLLFGGDLREPMPPGASHQHVPGNADRLLMIEPSRAELTISSTVGALAFVDKHSSALLGAGGRVQQTGEVRRGRHRTSPFMLDETAVRAHAINGLRERLSAS
jgi:hypothetical protein